MWARESVRVCVCVRESVCESERACVCVRERESVCERVGVCVSEREVDIDMCIQRRRRFLSL